MVKLLVVFYVLMLSGCSTDINKTTNSKKASVNLSMLASVHIENNGDYSGNISSDESPEMCKDFILTESDVFDFFVRSRPITLREYQHDLTASNCYASGSFVSKNGVEGTWKIDRSRRGFLSTPNSDSAYYYCGECTNQLFYESCESECGDGE